MQLLVQISYPNYVVSQYLNRKENVFGMEKRI